MLKFLKPLSILLIVGIMCLPGILCVYYEVAQFQVREEMEEKLEHEKLQQLQMAVADINWYKEGKEILLNGALFDIKSLEIIDGIAYMTGLYDAQEMHIKKQLHSLQEKQEKDQGTGRMAAKWASQVLYFMPLHSEAGFFLPIEKINYGHSDPRIPTAFSAIIVPPPEV